MAHVAIANAQPGDRLPIGSKVATVVKIGAKTVTVAVDGVNRTVSTTSPTWEAMVRDVDGRITASQHGVDPLDVLKMLGRDPAFTRDDQGLPMLRDVAPGAAPAQAAKYSLTDTPLSSVGKAPEATATTPNAEAPVATTPQPTPKINTLAQRILTRKSTTQLSDSGGRKIYQIAAPTVYDRQAFHEQGRFQPSDFFEIREKAAVTGIPQDRGYVLIDKREQAAARSVATADQAPAATHKDPGDPAFTRDAQGLPMLRDVAQAAPITQADQQPEGGADAEITLPINGDQGVAVSSTAAATLPTPAKPKLYKNRGVADAARKSLGNTHKLQKIKGGYILRAKTDREIEAEAKAARRLARGTPVDVNTDTLLTAIAKLGGLDMTERADTIGEGNRNLSGKMLFRRGGQKIDSMAGEALQELGYIPAEEIASDGGVRWLRDAIKSEFMGTRTHNSQAGTDWMDEAQRQAEMRQDETLSDFTIDELEAAGYTEAESPDMRALTEQLLSEAEAMGLDTEALIDDAMRATEGMTQDEYLAELKAITSEAIGQARSDAARRDTGRPGEGAESSGQTAGAAGQEAGPAEGLTLTQQTPDELRAKAQREEAAAAEDAAEKRKLAAKAAAETRKKNAAEEASRSDRVRRERADAAVDGFQLGQDAPSSVVTNTEAAGQQDVFGQAEPAAEPAGQATAKPAAWGADNKTFTKEVAAAYPAAQVEQSDEAPQVTESQARKQFEWRDLGQKDGNKTHALFFYVDPADKGTGRAMGRGNVQRYDGSNGWQIDGEGQKFPSLADAKKAAIEAAIPVLREQGWIEPVAAPAVPVAQEKAEPASQATAKPAAWGADNKTFTKDAADAARALLRKKLGQVSSGIDPELLQAGLTLAGYHLEAGARTFAKFARAMVDDLGDGVKPYLKSWYAAISFDPRASDFATDMTPVAEMANTDIDAALAQNQGQEATNAPSTDTDLERDRQDAGSGEPGMGADLLDNRSADGAAAAGNRAGSSRRGHADDQGVPADRPTAERERGDQPMDRADRADIPAEFTSRDPDSERSDDPGIEGVQPEAEPAGEVARSADQVAKRAKRAQEQRAAEAVGVEPGDLDNIRQTLPFLLPGQQEDVHKAEQRFAKPDGYGMLFTNGTGTGKTYSGLGIVKRFARQGKTNTLIVVPDDKIAADWIESARDLGLTITKLADTKSAGKGIVVASYANVGANAELARRDWHLVVADEAHSLKQSEDGTDTLALDTVRAITLHPRGVLKRAAMLHGDVSTAARLKASAAQLAESADDPRDRAKAEGLEAEAAELWAEWGKRQAEVKADVAARQLEQRPRLVALSATPFAYVPTVDWAEGYLFDYGGNESTGAAYNSGSASNQFFMRHFGFRMRYNKLTKPDANVDSGLMERQFNTFLRKQGTLSTRALEVDADYDRRFVLVESAIGADIDAAINWLEEKGREFGKANDKGLPSERPSNGYQLLRDDLDKALYGKLGYLLRRYLLEAIKAKEVISHVREHLAMGRKVVVFHDFKKGGATNPFAFVERPLATGSEWFAGVKLYQLPGQLDAVNSQRAARNAAVAEFQTKFPTLSGDNLQGLMSPVNRFTQEFPGVLLINGDQKLGDLLKRYKEFNDDSTGPVVALVQSDKNKGWSGHDTTGKHQRVLFNLGLPTAPTKAIQQEGRIYRTGQVSDAIMRYLNTGTNWEKWAFAQTIAARAGTAENLGSGEQARALKDAFIAAFEGADEFRAGHEGEGKGGKAADRATASVMSEFDRAKTFYWATQKKTARNKAREGVDYFATPEPVGMKMVQWAGARDGEDAIEPSGGHGAIARWFGEKVNRTAIEPSNELGARLAMVFDGKIVRGDFESHNIVNKYHVAAMNPPFGTAGRTAIDHLAKVADQHLRDYGRVVAIIPEGPAADKKFDAWFHEQDDKGRSVRPSLHLVGEVKLPGVSFERAGAGVRTRIVIIDRLPKDVAPTRATKYIDLSDAEDIKELFERIENIDMPERQRAPEAPALRQTNTTQRAQVAEQRTKNALAGDELANSLGLEVTEYTTGKGKLLRGVLRPDLTQEQAKAVDPHSWNMRGGVGYFIRLEHLAKLQEQFPLAEPKGGMMSRADQQSTGVPMVAAIKVVGDIRKAMPGAPPIAIHQTVAEAPADLVAWLRRAGALDQVEAAWYGGKVHVFPGQIASVERMKWVVGRHELRHVGLDGLLGDARETTMLHLWHTNKSVRDGAQGYIDEFPGTSRATAVEEVLADMPAEKVAGLRGFARLAAAVRAGLRRLSAAARDTAPWLADMLEPKRWTDGDVADLVRRAEDVSRAPPVQAGSTPAARELGVPQRSRNQSQTDTPAFKRWFGDSAVVDAAGKPLVVYHGTTADFSEFDTATVGPMTKGSKGLAGAYFATSPKGAEPFAQLDGGNIGAFFLSIKSPASAATVARATYGKNRAAADGALVRQRLIDAGHDGANIDGNWVAFYPAQIKSAIGNSGAFDPADPDVRLSRKRHAGNQPVLDALTKAGIGESPSLASRWRGVLDAISAGWENKGYALDVVRQGLPDQFHGIRRAERGMGLDHNQSGYIAARLANGGATPVMHALLMHGQAKWAANGQHLEKIPGTKGLIDVLEPLGEDMSDWFGWMVGNRAARLKREGRENLFTDADITALQGLATPANAAKFKQAAREYTAFKRSVLDIAQEAGLIDPGARAAWDHADYIPFYRSMDDNAKGGPAAMGKRGLSGQSSGVRQLRGGQDMLRDPLTNVLQNFSRLIDASLKNNAIAKVVEIQEQANLPVLKRIGYDMAQANVPRAEIEKQLIASGTPVQIMSLIPPQALEGMARMWALRPPADPDVIRVMRAGKPVYYRVADPLLLRSLTSFVPFDFPGLALMRGAKRLLTNLVTSTPTFVVANFIRDTVASQAIARDWINPYQSAAGVIKSFRETGAAEAMMFAGASFSAGQSNAADPEGTAIGMRRVLRRRGITGTPANKFMATVLDTPAKVYDMLKRTSDAVENANREAVYEAAVKAGRGATQAAFESKDLMDFSLRGSWPAYQMLADVVPFLNARVQGLYRLGQSDPKRLAIVGGILMTATLLLGAANDGEDWYEELPEWDRDTYWHFKLNGVHIRLPKPFEVGVVFATIPERVSRNLKGLDTGKRTLNRIGWNLKEQLKVDVMPWEWQLFKPAVEVMNNHDGFTGRDIESVYDKDKRPHARYDSRTSATMVALAKTAPDTSDALGLGPKKMQHLIEGYLGTIGATALAGVDIVTREIQGAPVRPTPRLDELPIVGRFVRMDPAWSTRWESDLYDYRRQVTEIYKEADSLEKQDRDYKAAAELRIEEAGKLSTRSVLESAARQLSSMRKMREDIMASRTMTPDQKRTELDKLQRVRNDLTRATASHPAIAGQF